MPISHRIFTLNLYLTLNVTLNEIITLKLTTTLTRLLVHNHLNSITPPVASQIAAFECQKLIAVLNNMSELQLLCSCNDLIDITEEDEQRLQW